MNLNRFAKFTKLASKAVNTAQGVNNTKKLVMITMVLTALACIPTTFLITKYVFMPTTSLIGNIVKGVRNIEQEKANEDFYKKSIKEKDQLIASLRTSLDNLERQEQEQIRIVMKTETETVEVVKEVERIVEVPIETIITEGIPEDSPVRQNLASCQEGLDSLTNLVSALQVEIEAKDQLISIEAEKFFNLEEQNTILVSKFEQAEIRIKQLKQRRIRWGVGTTVGVSPSFNNNGFGVSPSVTVGLTFMWG